MFDISWSILFLMKTLNEIEVFCYIVVCFQSVFIESLTVITYLIYYLFIECLLLMILEIISSYRLLINVNCIVHCKGWRYTVLIFHIEVKLKNEQLQEFSNLSCGHMHWWGEKKLLHHETFAWPVVGVSFCQQRFDDWWVQRAKWWQKGVWRGSPHKMTLWFTKRKKITRRMKYWKCPVLSSLRIFNIIQPYDPQRLQTCTYNMFWLEVCEYAMFLPNP